MVYSLNYRRPTHVAPSVASLSGEEKQESINESVNSKSSQISHGIPEALSFDRIIAGGTCPPCTTRDFMNYLKYIELAAENLQFYLWFRDYQKRFGELPASESILAPEWTVEQAEAAAASTQNLTRSKRFNEKEVALFSELGPSPKSTETEKGNPFHTPPRTPASDRIHDQASVFSAPGDNNWNPETKIGYLKKAEDTFENAGLQWQPIGIQPFGGEIARIVSIYIAEGAPRELNLSAKERLSLLHALQSTTHPSAFRDVLVIVEWALRCQSHPNFIRWTICNGNRSRVIFARGLGVAGIIGGIITGVLLCLSGAGRAWRVMAFIGFMVGISTLIAAWKGMCVVLHGMHHRHLRPWELFSDADEASNIDLETDVSPKMSMESNSSSKSWESEPWIAKYQKRNIVRKIFDREVWIEEPALRQIQDTIFIQALIGAFVISAVSTGVFVAVPKGGFF